MAKFALLYGTYTTTTATYIALEQPKLKMRNGSMQLANSTLEKPYGKTITICQSLFLSISIFDAITLLLLLLVNVNFHSVGSTPYKLEKLLTALQPFKASKVSIFSSDGVKDV